MERAHHGSEQLYFKSGAEMARAVRGAARGDRQHAARSPRCAAGAANPLKKPMLPRFQVPDGMDEAASSSELARKGLDERFAEFAAIGKHVDRGRATARASRSSATSSRRWGSPATS